MPPGWPTGRVRLAVVPEARQEQQPDADWLDKLWADPEFGVPASAVAGVPAVGSVDDLPEWSGPDVAEIADRDPSDAHAVDWDRVKAAVRRARPVRTLAVIGAGVAPAWMWAVRVAAPMSEAVSVHATYATAVLTAAVAVAGAVNGGPARRLVCALLLVAAVGGTLIAEPTRLLVAAWIVGA